LAIKAAKAPTSPNVERIKEADSLAVSRDVEKAIFDE